MAAFVLFFVVAYRTLHMPPPSNPAGPDFDSKDSAAQTEAPSVPPPPPLSDSGTQRKHRRAVPADGTARTPTGEFDANGTVIREYASGDADPGPNGAPELSAAIEPVSDSAPAPVFVTPPELPRRDSRGLRWIKAMGKALHIVPQKDPDEDTFRAAPNGQ